MREDDAAVVVLGAAVGIVVVVWSLGCGVYICGGRPWLSASIKCRYTRGNKVYKKNTTQKKKEDACYPVMKTQEKYDLFIYAWMCV